MATVFSFNVNLKIQKKPHRLVYQHIRSCFNINRIEKCCCSYLEGANGLHIIATYVNPYAKSAAKAATQCAGAIFNLDQKFRSRNCLF